MRRTITRLPALFAVLTFVGALAFGAATALESMPPCTPGLPPHTCPPTQCGPFCSNNGYVWGDCVQSQGCCLCVE